MSGIQTGTDGSTARAAERHADHGSFAASGW
jgi:hypothetical protein